jgi:hypothetical protein
MMYALTETVFPFGKTVAVQKLLNVDGVLFATFRVGRFRYVVEMLAAGGADGVGMVLAALYKLHMRPRMRALHAI